jgi:hypothetical protein
MRKMRIVAAAMLLTGATAAQAQDIMAPPFHRTFHYERTNIDGTEREQIYFHRAAPGTVQVYKMMERCTRSALVTATIDPQTGEASRLVAARLLPRARSEPYAEMNYDPAAGRIDATISAVNPPLHLALAVPTRPWHLYDYDLGTLAAALQARPGSRESFSFGMALVWPGASPPLTWMGDAHARFVGAERHLGRDTLRFEVTGSAFGEAGGGPLWVAANDSHLVDVQWGRPNHDGYKDFRLRLIGEEPEGEAAWTALLTRHFEGCPVS